MIQSWYFEIQKIAPMQMIVQMRNIVQNHLQTFVQLLLQKNGTDAEIFADAGHRAELRADDCAVIRADEYAELGAVGRAVVRAGAKKRAASAAGVQSSNFSLAIE